jgi:hypothetical protein
MIQMSRTFGQTAPGPGDNSVLVHPADVISQVTYGYDLGQYPVRYATLYPIIFDPNALSFSLNVQYTNGLGSG